MTESGEDAPARRPGADPDFDPLAESKRLLRSIRAGALGTLNGSGDPFSTLVTVATDPDGSPLILVSQLSAHTRHLDGDPRCSLLLAETGAGDPLTHPRLTLTGKAIKVAEPAARRAVRARFLARHPRAEAPANPPAPGSPLASTQTAWTSPAATSTPVCPSPSRSPRQATCARCW